MKPKKVVESSVHCEEPCQTKIWALRSIIDIFLYKSIYPTNHSVTNKFYFFCMASESEGQCRNIPRSVISGTPSPATLTPRLGIETISKPLMKARVCGDLTQPMILLLVPRPGSASGVGGSAAIDEEDIGGLACSRFSLSSVGGGGNKNRDNKQNKTDHWN
ncbi:hypothetical protein YC2023_033491 [Brassica napus]